MGMVPIDNLTAGLVLKSSISDRRGRLLLPSGTELAEKHLQVLRMWGVREADIEGVEASETPIPESPADIDPALLAAAEAAIHELFRHCDPQDRVVHELMRLCILRRIEHA